MHSTVEDASEPAGPLVPSRHSEGLGRVADCALGPGDPLGHSRLGHQEGVRDLGGGKATDRPERQGDGRLELVLADRAAGHRVVQQAEPFGDALAVP